MSLAGIVLLSFVGAALARPVALVAGRSAGWVAAVLPAALFLAVLGHADEVARVGEVRETFRWVPSLGVEFGLRLDGFSLLFALLITGIGALVVIYAGAYFSGKGPAKRAKFLAFILLFMSAMLGTVLADDLIVMFVFWEATSMMSFMLIGFESTKPEARRSALQSLLVTGGGGLALFAGILLLGSVVGSYSLSEAVAQADRVAASPLAGTIVALMLAGAFTKSAQFPFHFWLPNAMQAPTPASAYLHSATMVKLGVYLLARLDGVFAAVPAFGATLLVAGSVTMLAAAVGALRATGFKAVLAYSTVASLGILVMLIGLDGSVAAVATVGFILAHACYKAALFFCAGNAIHAAGTARLRHMGGLARHLPFTAAAVVLASLSMAGLPPFIGFISKEYLFEAQLGSPWKALLVAVAVLVNAVMVGVAGVVSLRPFFLKRDRVSKVRHGETPGLLAGPLTLAAAGIVMGLAPGPVTRTVIEPAARALNGSAIDVSFKLWHGLTPMLALSALVVAVGVWLTLRWDAIHFALRRRRKLGRLLGDGGYDAVLARVLGFAGACARVFQSGDPRRYTAVVVAATVAIVGYGLARSGVGPVIDTGGDLRIAPAVVLGVAVAGAVASTLTPSLLAAVVAVGIVGFASALLFLMNGAPDLALTQFGVETLFVVMVMAVLLRLPLHSPSMRTSGERRLDATLSAAFGLLVFIALASMSAAPLDTRLSDYFAAVSLPEAFGRNVVNVIIVDFRGVDTLGEIAVVTFAMIAVWSLLRGGTSGKRASGTRRTKP